MNKASKILFTILIAILAVAMVACNTTTVDSGDGTTVTIEYSKIETITVDEASVADGFLLSEFDITKIILNVKYFDTQNELGGSVEGEVIPMPAAMNMVKAEDKTKLRVAGEKEITLVYGKFEIPVKFTLIDTTVLRYSVTFLDTEGNRIGDVKYVSEGGRVTPPALETVSDSIFAGWRDRNTGEMSTLDNITSNLVLEAVYQPKNYSVNFYTRIGNEETLIKTVSIANGERVLDHAPEIPIRLGYSNGRWENVEDMGVVSEKILDFYAIYDRDQVQVGFTYRRYGEAVGTYYNAYDVGSTVPNPPPAECAGWKFVEWRIGGKKAEFPYEVTVEVEFTAYYIHVIDGNAGLGYTRTEGGYEVTSYTGKEPIVVIPEKYNGEDVVSVRDGVFKNCDISEFIVSNSNKYFIAEDGVLFNVDKTKLIAYPNLKTDVEDYYVGSTVKEIGAYAFYRSVIKSAGFTEELEEIGAYAFADCDNLTVVNVPSGIVKIGESAFESKSGKSVIAAVNFDGADSLKEIGDHAFKGLGNLKTVALPAALTTLGKGVFAECKSIATVAAIDNANFVVDRNGMLLSADRSTLYLYPAMYDGNVETYLSLDPECATIEEGAFTYSRISGIIIQSAVVIEDAAFNCPNLSCLVITPEGSVSAKISSFSEKVPDVIYVDGTNSSFAELNREFNSVSAFLSYSDFEHGNEYHDGYIYEIYEYTEELDGGTRLMRGVRILGSRLSEGVVVIPSTIGDYPVTAIGESAFEGDNFIEELNLPSDLRTIEKRAFFGMEKLKRVVLNDVIVEIEDEAFANCSTLATVAFGSGLTTITSFGQSVFKGTQYMAEANGDVIVGNVLVQYNGFSSTVSVSGEVGLIAPEAFMGRGEITALTFEGNNLKYIERDAFMNCVGLSDIEFPASLREIRKNAFSYCDNIKKVKFRVESSNETLFIDGDAFGTNKKIKFEYVDTELYTLYFHIDDNNSERMTGLIFTEAYETETRSGAVFGGWYHEGEAAGANAYTNLVEFPFDPTDPELQEIIGLKDDPTKTQFNVYAKWIPTEDNSMGTAGIIFRQTDDGSYAVTGYDGVEKYVIIPSRYKNRDVVAIDDYAFAGQTQVQYLVLPHSRSVDGSWSCDLTEIGENAFDDTGWYKSVYGDFVIVDDFLIKYKGSSKTVVIPESVKKIAKGAFNGNRYVETVIFDAQVESIAENAFKNCNNLVEVKLPESLYTIQSGAFNGCTALKNINFEDCPLLNSVKADAFEGTSWLNDYVGSCVMINDILYRYNGLATSLHIFNGVTQIGESAFKGNRTLAYVFIPQSVTQIGDRAFESSTVQSVNIYAGGSNLMQIGGRAFYDCYALSFIDLMLASNLVYIGEYAFCGDTSLKSINIPDSVTDIGEGAFSHSGLTSVIFAAGEKGSKLKVISSYAFAYNYSLFSVRFGGASQLVEIGESAFEDCRSLQSFVNLFGKVEVFGARAFYNCDNLTDFNIDAGALNEIGDDALGSDLKGYIGTVGDDNMAVIGNILVKYNGYDTVINIPTNVTTIYNRAFAGNPQITDIVFNWNKNEDGEVTVRSNIKTINAEAFDGCSSLKNIDFPDTITYVGNNAVRDTLWYKERESEEFVIISNTLIKYNGVTAKQVILPDKVEAISAGAFDGATVYDIVIGANVKRIEVGAFDGIVTDKDFGKWTLTVQAEVPPTFELDGDSADSLDCATVFMPSASVMDTYRLNDSWNYLYDRMEVMPEYALSFDVGSFGAQLDDMSVYALYEEIDVAVTDDNYVFAGWYTADGERISYPYILIEETVLYAQYTSLEQGSAPEYYLVAANADDDFYTINLYQGENVSKIVVISQLADSEVIGKIGQAFVADANGNYIYEEANDRYIENAEGVAGTTKYRRQGAYEGHNEIREVTFANNSQITVIGADAFKNCKGLRKIVLPASVKKIEKGAFYGCDRLEEVIFSEASDGVEIESGAFENCKALRAITLPEGVTELGDGAFKGCTNLIDITLKSTKPIQLTNGGDEAKRPFEILDGMVIRIPNKSQSSYEVYWQEYAKYLKEEAQDAVNENE